MTNAAVDFRRDKRSLDEFAKDIKTWTRREQVWAKIVANDIEEHFNYRIEIRSTKHSHGKVIKKKIGKSQPDTAFIICDRRIPVEIKSYYTDKPFHKIPYFTFKLSSIKSVVRYSGMLVVVNANWWLSIDHVGLSDILHRFSPTIFYGFSPNDKVIRLTKNDMSILLKQKEFIKYHWTPTSTELIKEYAKALF